MCGVHFVPFDVTGGRYGEAFAANGDRYLVVSSGGLLRGRL